MARKVSVIGDFMVCIFPHLDCYKDLDGKFVE